MVTAARHSVIPPMVLLACASPDPPTRSANAEPNASDVAGIFRTHLGRTWELVRIGDQDLPAPAANSRSTARDVTPDPGVVRRSASRTNRCPKDPCTRR